MTDPRDARLEQRLARGYQAGTALGCLLIAPGVILLGFRGSSVIPVPWTSLCIDLIRCGVATFILLPIFRLVVVGVRYARQRDPVIAGIAALALGILVLAVIVGLRAAAGNG